jgi:hypothetical protein
LGAVSPTMPDAEQVEPIVRQFTAEDVVVAAAD